MEPRQYLVLLRRWAWLLILGVVIGVAGGFIFSRFQTPIYRATTRILISQQDSAYAELLGSSQQIAATYTELLLTRPVLDATSERLGVPVRSSNIQVQQVRDAQIVAISVEDTDPNRAADIANTLVQVFLEQNAAMQQSRYAESEQSLQNQIQSVSDQISMLENELSNLSEQGFESQQEAVTTIIANLQNEINQLNAEIVALQFDYPLVESRDPFTGRIVQLTATPSVEQRQELVAKQTRLEELQSILAMYRQISVNLSLAGEPTSTTSFRTQQIQAALSLYQQIYSNLLSNYESIRLARFSSAPNVVPVEEARPPFAPIRPRPVMNMAFGAILGLLLSGGIVVLIETMNNTLRTPEDVTELLGAPVLGYISEMTSRKKEEAQAPYVLLHPRSPVTEAFRSLRTNLQFTELDKPLKTLLISSQGSAEGKTTIAVNLAIVIAQTGKRVILLDADLRRPRVHAELKLPNRVGLSNILRERIPPERVYQRYRVDNLYVITSGGLPPNPAEVLSSARMAETLRDLASTADIVIVDGPPLVFGDSLALAATTDGLLMVVRPDHTDAQAAVATVEQLQRVGARLVGIVMNWVKVDAVNSYYGHYRTYARYTVNGSDPVIADLEETQPTATPRK
jgi:succinoglycan biosynthesis transport protein ExoP